MGKRSRNKGVPAGEFPAHIDTLSHDGRGIARIDGKTVFVSDALPGEQLHFSYTRVTRRFDEAQAVRWDSTSAARVTPTCEHARVCGGCSLQHMTSASQLECKQLTLAEQLQHFGHVQPKHWLEPLSGPQLGYRSKARLGVRYVPQKGLPLVGFREKGSSKLAEISHCPVLEAPLDNSIMALRELVMSLDVRARLPQIEMARGDTDTALVFRHLDALSDGDRAKLVDFCRERGWHCYLQPGNEATTQRIWPLDGAPRLSYSLPDFGLTMAFHPHDFTQVNRVINRSMTAQALALLDIEPQHRVLDLFCGLGNFTLPLATRAAQVVGVEVSAAMVERGTENAHSNGLDNVSFYGWDLTQDARRQAWAKKGFDRILIDPPRAGAQEVIPLMTELGAAKLVYVSCNPATLARDAGELAARGYRLEAAGVMDMFPHTTHVESMALFVRD